MTAIFNLLKKYRALLPSHLLSVSRKHILIYTSVIYLSSLSTFIIYLNLYKISNVAIFFSELLIFYSNVSLLLLFLLFVFKIIEKQLSVVSKTLKYFVFSIIALHSVVCILDLLVVIYFKHQITAEFIFILIETNAREASEFISSYFNINILKFLLLLIAPIVSLKLILISDKLKSVIEKVLITNLLLIFIIFLTRILFDPSYQYGAYLELYSSRTPTYRLIKNLIDYQKEMRKYESVIEERFKSGLIENVSDKNKTSKNTFIFVIGESTNRNHMSIYGYERETNPKLKEIEDQLFVFTNVISPHSHTIESLKKMLTLANYSNKEKKWYNYNFLSQYFQNSGFKTYWISNQEVYSIWGGSTVVLPIALTFDATYFNQTGESNNDQKLSNHDEELLVYLESVLNETDKNKFIILHLMGNHTNYKNRYPSTFDKFKDYKIEKGNRSFLTKEKEQIINEYDNSILYNDYFMYKLIEQIEDQNDNSYVLFTSDHGEEVYDNRNLHGHTETLGNRHMVEIPFILWVSKNYKLNNKGKISSIDKNLNSPYMTDDVIHTILDLSNLEHSTFNSSRSIVSKNFNNKRRRFYNKFDYDIDLKERNTADFIQRNQHKVWAHRVNSIDKLNLAKEKYFGVELDIVFIENDSEFYFDVNHPPAKSISLSLNTYLSNIKEANQLQFWLDLKNLNSQNQEKVYKRLLFLIKKYNLHDKAIIESQNFKCLHYLTKMNLKTSYYLPNVNIESLNNKEKREIKIDLIKKIKLANVHTISYPGNMHEFVKKYLSPEFSSLDLMTWYPLDIRNPSDAAMIQSIVDEANVKVVLTKYQTEFDR